MVDPRREEREGDPSDLSRPTCPGYGFDVADRQTLNLLAAILCGIGSAAALFDGLRAGGFRTPGARASVLSGLFGTIGSIAWAASAYQDRQQAHADHA